MSRIRRGNKFFGHKMATKYIIGATRETHARAPILVRRMRKYTVLIKKCRCALQQQRDQDYKKNAIGNQHTTTDAIVAISVATMTIRFWKSTFKPDFAINDWVLEPCQNLVKSKCHSLSFAYLHDMDLGDSGDNEANGYIGAIRFEWRFLKAYRHWIVPFSPLKWRQRSTVAKGDNGDWVRHWRSIYCRKWLSLYPLSIFLVAIFENGEVCKTFLKNEHPDTFIASPDKWTYEPL